MPPTFINLLDVKVQREESGDAQATQEEVETASWTSALGLFALFAVVSLLVILFVIARLRQRARKKGRTEEKHDELLWSKTNTKGVAEEKYDDSETDVLWGRKTNAENTNTSNAVVEKRAEDTACVDTVTGENSADHSQAVIELEYI